MFVSIHIQYCRAKSLTLTQDSCKHQHLNYFRIVLNNVLYRVWLEISQCWCVLQDPLSLPSVQESTNYMDMSSSMHSLSLISRSPAARSKIKHLPLSRSDRPLAQLSMSPSSVCQSLDLSHSGFRAKLGSHSSAASVMSPCKLYHRLSVYWLY